MCNSHGNLNSEQLKSKCFKIISTAKLCVSNRDDFTEKNCKYIIFNSYSTVYSLRDTNYLCSIGIPDPRSSFLYLPLYNWCCQAMVTSSLVTSAFSLPIFFPAFSGFELWIARRYVSQRFSREKKKQILWLEIIGGVRIWWRQFSHFLLFFLNAF